MSFKLIGHVFVALAALGVANRVDASEYLVRHDESNSALYVRACFDAGRGFSLSAASRDASDFLIFARYGDDRRVSLSRNRMYIPASESRRCVRYGVDLGAIVAKENMRSGYAINDTLLSWSGTWLWRPRGSLEGDELVFNHAPHIGISAPWPLIERQQEQTRYRLDATPSDWSNLIAIGPFEPLTLKTEGGELRAAIISPGSQAQQRKLIRWLQATVNAVTQIYGAMPLDSPQILVAPIRRGSGPVPWAQVQRGGGSAVHLFVNPELDLETFIKDWTASHEFSHLFHPFMGSDGRWLAEGLASYYQNVSRARAGQLDPQQAWKKLNAGFGRGRKDAGQVTLSHANRNIREGRYMQVYWTGAAIALIADVELRQRSDGQQSLDTVLAEFAACYLPASRLWRVDETLKALDRIAQSDVFMRLYHRYVDNRRFPDLDRTYQALGISESRGRLSFSDADGDALELRTELMGQSIREHRVASCATKRQPVG
jgi:hypothetical protein